MLNSNNFKCLFWKLNLRKFVALYLISLEVEYLLDCFSVLIVKFETHSFTFKFLYF